MGQRISAASNSEPLGATVLLGAWNQLRNLTQCEVLVGAEIEFYLDMAYRPHHLEILDRYALKLIGDGIPMQEVKKEIGECQYEIALHPCHDPLFLAESIVHLRALALEIGHAEGCRFSFAARELVSEPPSALHVNVSLVDQFGVNKYSKAIGVEAETEAMQHSIAGLCDFMNASMKFFAPKEDSFKRFANPFADGPYWFANAPTTVSWGGNNRTVAIRIPESSLDPNSRHLEHRVPCSDAEPNSVIACILSGIAHGIAQRIPLRQVKVWGNASEDPNLVPLVRTLPEAITWHQGCLELRSRLEVNL